MGWWLSDGWVGAPPHFMARTTCRHTSQDTSATFLSLPGPVVGEMPSATRLAAVGMVGRPFPHVVLGVLCVKKT